MRHGRFFAAVVLAVAAASSSSAQICPQVYEVAGTGDPSQPPDLTYNVLFLGNGFTAADLDTYHRAIELYVARLATTEPFQTYRDRMKFYYIDLVTSMTGLGPRCTCAGPVPSTTTMPRPGIAVPMPVPAEPTKKLNLKVACSCDASGACTGVDLPVDRQTAALGLSFCAPFDVRAVVILANANCGAGLTAEVALLMDLSWAVIGISADAGSPDLDIWDSGLAAFQHELGHQLGLLDEYTDSGSVWLFPTDRNVWKKDSLPDDWLPDPVKPTCPDIPWDRAMCPAGMPAPPRCDTFLKNCCPGGTVAVPPLVREGCLCSPNSMLGLWEGALYQDKGFFRAAKYCRMKDLLPTSIMCAGCTRHLSDVLCQHGSAPGTECPPPMTTWCPAPPYEVLF